MRSLRTAQDSADTCALGTDILEDRQEDFESLAAAVPRFASMLLAPEEDPDALDILTPRSYAEAITGEHSRWHVDFQGEAAAGFLPAFKARYVARGFSQRQEVDLFQTFSPTPKMTTLRVLLHVAAQRDYELHSKDFSTAFLQSSLHEEIWLRCPPGFTGSFPAGTQWSLRRPVYGLRQGPREWHDTLRTTLAALGFAPSTADPSLFLRTDTLLPPFYVLVYVDDLVFATVDTEALTLVKSELQKRHTCTDLGELRSYLGLQITRDRARRTITLTQSHMVHQVLQHFSFQFSSPHPTSQCTSQSLSAPTSDESLEPSGLYLELVGCLIRHISAKILLAIAAARHLPLCQIDVKNVFLYELVDAYLHNILLEIRFKQLPHDPGMYRRDFRDEYILLTVYVDDLLYTRLSNELLEQFEKSLARCVDITCNHDVKQFLGLNISYSPEAIHLSAAKYAEELGKRFNIAPAPLSTPYHTLGPNHKPGNKALSPTGLHTYQQQLGCLLFASVTCRPDLSYIASQLAQYSR
ncbi:unnamed protein product [Closterium sp. NIES-54]